MIIIRNSAWTMYFKYFKSKGNVRCKGKYIFLSKLELELYRLMEEYFKDYGFFSAKISTRDCRVDGDFVLCLNFQDDSQYQELRKRFPVNYNKDDVRFCGWKSDKDTFDKIYSNNFLNAR